MFNGWRQSGTVLGASVLLAFFGLASRILGLARDRILASKFGASDILDVYYISFTIPDLIFNLIIAGAISSALIPIFIQYRERSNEEAQKLINNFLNHALVIMAVLIGVAFWLTPWLLDIIAPGFESAKKELAVLFMRVMLISPFVFTVSAVLGSVLQAQKRFLAYAIAPLSYNIGIIIGAVWFVPWFGPLGLAEGVVLGALLHLGTQLFDIKKINFRWQKVWQSSDVGLRKIYSLMIPRALGLGFNHVGWIVLSAMATTLSVGAVAIFNFAYNLHYLPIALVGISVATAYFPDLSQVALDKPKSEVLSGVSRYLKYILLVLIPAAVLAYLFRFPIISLILKAGLFNFEDTQATANIFGFLLIGVPAQGIIPVLVRTFYAFQNTITPTLIGVFSVLLMVVMAWMFLPSLGLAGLALAFSTAGIIQVILLILFLRKLLNF